MKKLIETALPLSEINAKTISERTIAGHPANLHMWWGRSPHYSSIVSLTSALADASENMEETKTRLSRVLDGSYPEFGDKPTVFDPFSGFGGIPLAAQMLDLPVVAGDLNPVAVMLTKAATEIPAKFAGCRPVNDYSLFKDYKGSEGLAEDVQYYGEWLEQKAQEKLKDIYPNEPEGRSAAWIWARTVKCPNPACGCQMPMVNSFVINDKPGYEKWIEPIVKDGVICFEIRDGKCPKDKVTNKYAGLGAKFVCPACGEITKDAYVKQMGMEHQIDAQMMCTVIDQIGGRSYISPTDLQINAAAVPTPEDIPQGEIPNNSTWFSPPGFGFTNYSDLFSSRQLLMLTTFCELLKDVQDKIAIDALAAGMSPEGGSLADGGNGALAYGQAVSVYLAFAIDKMADRNSTICSWKSSGAQPRATFGRQAIPMVWNYAECNPFSTFPGNFKSILRGIVTSLEKLPCGSQVNVYQGDAVTSVYPEKALICTELPYYRAIGYAHLSDFFYIWMRRSLKSVFSELFNQMVTSKEELSTVGQFYGKPQKECEQEYEEKMRIVLAKLYQSSNPIYPSLLFFEYHKADAKMMREMCNGTSPWEIMMQSMIDEGFAINAVWPMRSEAYSEKADGTRVLIVARKVEKTEQSTRRGFITTLKRELPELIETAFCAGVDDCDKEIIAMGCGLSVFSRYKRIMNADGSNMNAHDALQLIYQEIKDLINDENSTESTDTKED